MSRLNANAQPFVPVTAAANVVRTNLRANAQPFSTVATVQAEEHHAARRRRRRTTTTTYGVDERSLFMTFSSGAPLTEREIKRFFTRELGMCVENVYVGKAENRDPEFGKITFGSCVEAERILMNEEVVKIWVNDKPIWLKKYVPRRQRRSMMAQN